MRNGSLRLKRNAAGKPGSWYLRAYVGGRQRDFKLGEARQFMNKKEVR